MAWNQSLIADHRLVKNVRPAADAAQSSFSSRIIILWLVGTVIFLPIKIINLPFNFELVDAWILMGLPIAILYIVVRPRQLISLAYILPMWLVMISSFLSSFSAPSATNSIVVIFKESYIFVWFISLTMLLYKLKASDLRIVLVAWSIVVILHGLLMIAQFLSPEIWRLTNSLGGNAARIEGYRAAGLFICDKAGCANKAAYFQLLGFVPILLAGFSKRTTIILGITLLVSMLTTGSMGGTLAFSTGLIVAGLTIAFYKNRMFLVLKYFVRFVIAASLLGGFFYIVTSLNQDYRDHFEKIIVGRYDKSSGGRFDLWQRGIDALVEHNAFFWGVGPENFRVVDTAEADNQLHNDTLAFLVERGLIGVLGLALFAGVAVSRAFSILQFAGKAPNTAHLGLVIFLAVIAATMVESLTHQMFRTRELWLVLAIMEAVYFYMKTSESGAEQPSPGMNEPSHFHRNSLVRS
jgi:O-antigen ligase